MSIRKTWLKRLAKKTKREKRKKRADSFNGLDLSIEFDVGDEKPVKDGTVVYEHPYGEVAGTHAQSDGDPVDVYVSVDAAEGAAVYVVHQLAKDGSYDEDKCLLGFGDEESALACYKKHGPPWGFGSIDTMTWDQFTNGYLKSNVAPEQMGATASAWRRRRAHVPGVVGPERFDNGDDALRWYNGWIKISPTDPPEEERDPKYKWDPVLQWYDTNGNKLYWYIVGTKDEDSLVIELEETFVGWVNQYYHHYSMKYGEDKAEAVEPGDIPIKKIPTDLPASTPEAEGLIKIVAEEQPVKTAWLRRRAGHEITIEWNKDKDIKLYEFQDTKIEQLPKQMQDISEANTLGTKLENAGDIFRELVGRDVADPGYMGEKTQKIRNGLSAPDDLLVQLSPEAKALADQIASLFQGLDLADKSDRLVAARDLSVALAQQDLGAASEALARVESTERLAQEESHLRRDIKRFEKIEDEAQDIDKSVKEMREEDEHELRKLSARFFSWRDRRAYAPPPPLTFEESVKRVLSGALSDIESGFVPERALNHSMGNWEMLEGMKHQMGGTQPEDSATIRQNVKGLMVDQGIVFASLNKTWNRRAGDVIAHTMPLFTKTAAELREFSSTQVQLGPGHARPIIALGKKIADEDIYDPPGTTEFGREDKPHITVKFGLHTGDPKDVAPLLEGVGPIMARPTGISFFRSEKTDYDVIKIDIESKDLERVNKLLRDSLEHTDTHPEYHPHMTLAYVKRGEAEKYCDDQVFADLAKDMFNGIELIFTEIVFSGKDKKKTLIPIVKMVSGSVWRLRRAKSNSVFDRLLPLKNLWYENKDGDRYYPSNDEMKDAYSMQELMDGDFPYQRFLAPILQDSVCTNEGQILRGETTINCIEPIVIHLITKKGWSLVDAITIAAHSCERCVNIMLEAVTGEPYTERDKAGTSCDICSMVDPEYYEEIMSKDPEGRRKDHGVMTETLAATRGRLITAMASDSRQLERVAETVVEKIMMDGVKMSYEDLLAKAARNLSVVAPKIVSYRPDRESMNTAVSNAVHSLFGSFRITRDDDGVVYYQSDLEMFATQVHQALVVGPKTLDELQSYMVSKNKEFQPDTIWPVMDYLMEDEKIVSFDNTGRYVIKGKSKSVEEVLDELQVVDVDSEKDRLLDEFSKGNLTHTEMEERVRRLEASAMVAL